MFSLAHGLISASVAYATPVARAACECYGSAVTGGVDAVSQITQNLPRAAIAETSASINA